MSTSRSLLLASLQTFYENNPSYCKVIDSIISGGPTSSWTEKGHGTRLSLRILDWFVTHYARMNKVVYYIDGKHFLEEYPDVGGSHIRKFNLYLEYRKQLQSYTKMFFDPFRRHERINFVTDTDIETTVGQLNFFRWATENHVISYVVNNLTKIDAHMALHQKSLKTHSIKRDFHNTMSHGPCHVLFN